MESHWAEGREARQGTNNGNHASSFCVRLFLANPIPRLASSTQKSISRIFEIDGTFLFYLFPFALYLFLSCRLTSDESDAFVLFPGKGARSSSHCSARQSPWVFVSVAGRVRDAGIVSSTCFLFSLSFWALGTFSELSFLVVVIAVTDSGIPWVRWSLSWSPFGLV
jgi:hypothetical protein